jgi:dipeptidase E
VKLVLYSGGTFDIQAELDAELMDLISIRRPMITYIPSTFEDSDKEYESFIEHYSEWGVRFFDIFHVDRPFTGSELKEAFAADAIYLAGGNTFYFLKHLKKSKVFLRLLKYAKQGGVIFGESAGAIIMTQSIATASYPSFDCDENQVLLTDWNALGLTEFEFFPHFEPEQKAYANELKYQSQFSQHPIYAVSDGSGIVIHDLKTSFIGDIWCFYQGTMLKVP